MSRFRTAGLALLLCSFAASLPAQVLRFGVIGDSGTGRKGQKESSQDRVARQMAAWQDKHPWELVLMLGDNIYEDGNPADFESKFKEPYKALREKGVKFHATLGNHDRRHDRARLGCAQVEDEAFGYEGKQDEYVLAAGPEIDGRRLVRFIALNSAAWIDQYAQGKPDETECRDKSKTRLDQFKEWLAESDKYHWNILFLHHPLYSYVRHWLIPPFLNGHGSSRELRKLLEPYLKDRVQVVFAGHDHFYQAIQPVFDGEADPQNGIHHFVSGGAAKLRRGGNFGHKRVKAGAKRLHFLDIELSRDELKYQAVDDAGRVFDSGSIKRNTPPRGKM